MIAQCSCHHKYQDKRYGKGMRVHNFGPKANKGNPGWRCTVCGAVKPCKKGDDERK